MKKMIASTLVVLLLAQSITPATYAATDYGYGATPATKYTEVRNTATTNASPATSFVAKYRSTDLGTLSTFGVMQTAIVGYASQIGGEEIFRDTESYYKLVNQFLDKYAPTFGFRMGDEVPAVHKENPDAYYQSLADTWSKNSSKEYNEVYTYAKTRQSTLANKDAATPVAEPTRTTAATACILSKEDENEIFQNKVSYEKLIQDGKYAEAAVVFKKIESLASKCSSGSSTSVVQFTQDCSIAYTRYMAEYNNLIAKNAPMAEITKIKSLIEGAAKGENCTLEAQKEQTVEAHKALVTQVKEALNFGKNTESVIPANVVPNYCESNVVNGLQEQLAANDTSELNQIKNRISDILEDDMVRSNQTKKSILQFALNTAATVETEKILQENGLNKESFAVDNLFRNLAVIVDSLISGRGANTILKFFDNNLDNLEAMSEALNNIGEYDSFEYVVQHGGSAYGRDKDTKEFVQQTDTAQEDITVAFPLDKDATQNDALVTLRSLKTHAYEQVSDRGSVDVKVSLDRYDLSTAAGFGQAAKDNGTLWSMGIPEAAISKNLYQTLEPNGTWYSDINGEQVKYVNFYIAQLDEEIRAYTNYDANVYVPAGSYEAYWSRYDIASNGTLTEIYINEVPLELAAKVEAKGRLIAAIEGKLTWASDEELKQSDSIFPTSIQGQIYLANFLLDVNMKREKVSGSNWRLSLDASLKGPSICTFEIQGEFNYKNGREADLELTEDDVIDANLSLKFNNDELTFGVEDMSSLVSTLQALDATADNKDEPAASVADYIDAINDHVEAVYSFNGQQLAQIVGDPEKYAVIVYPDGSTEDIEGLVTRYAGLVNTDYLMEVLEPFMGDGKEEPKEPDPVTSDYSKFYGNVWNDGSYVYASYSFTDQKGTNTVSVSPDQISMYVFTKGEGCESAYCTQTQYYPTYDGANYVFDYSVIANDPTVVAAYVYAAYTSPETGKFLDEKYYTIGSNDSINPTTPTAPSLDCAKPENMVLPACMPAPTAPTTDCKDPKNTALPECMMPSAPAAPTVTMDLAGYSLISAQDPEQFMIGFKLSTDPVALATPDSVTLTLYYMDGTKSSTSLTQLADGYYVGSNSFATDQTVKEAVVHANSIVDGNTVSTSSTLK